MKVKVEQREATMMEFKGERLKVFAFAVGGIGSGNLSVSGTGQLVAWQVTNNFSSGPNGTDGAIAPLTFFAVWAKQGERANAQILQTVPIGDLPTIKELRVENRFPFLRARYETDLPVGVELEAWSPFIPLNAKESALPLAAFTFTLHNPTKQPVDAAITMNLQNLVGWEGYRALQGLTHEEFVGNFNIADRIGHWTSVICLCREGDGDAFEMPIVLLTPEQDIAWLMRLTDKMTVRWLDWSRGVRLPMTNEATTNGQTTDGRSTNVVWLGELPEHFSEQDYARLLDAIEQGANAVLCGAENHPLAVLDAWAKGGQDAEVFADFEKGTYEGWTIEGNCFGDRPATGKIGWQQPVSGWRGKFFVNTFNPDDTATGRALSRPFKITKPFIHFLIGGGHHLGRCCLNLLVDGKVVRTATGRNSEQLLPQRWDVSEFVGKEARLEILDTETGPWGHILVDHIVFSDSPTLSFADPELVKALVERLPVKWRSWRWLESEPMTAVLNEAQRTLTVRRFWQADGLYFDAPAQMLAQTPDGNPLIVRMPMGKGSLLIVFGSPTEWVAVGQRRAFVGTLIAHAAQTRYVPMTGWRKTAPAFGTMALAVKGDKRDWHITTLPQHDDVQAMWRDFVDDGAFSDGVAGPHPTEAGKTCCGAIGAKITLRPNERRSVTFVVAWHFPNRYRTVHYGWAPPYEYRYRLGNRYNTWFSDAKEVVRYFTRHADRLYRETKAFADALWKSHLPEAVKDAIASNLAILRSSVLMWLEDGNFYGFEGADACCPLTCTHVYNYAQSIAFLFPELERTMRWVEWKCQQHPEEGYIPHRVIVPLNLPRLWGRPIGGPANPALDGMLGAVLKTYREFQLSGNRHWLAEMFPHVAKLMRHIFERFDPDGDGVIVGEQPNTYDIHTFGSNTFIGTLYLAALKAVERMAKVLELETGDRGLGVDDLRALAEECRRRFELGREGYLQRCWNGEFFINAYDAPDATPDTYERDNCWGIGCHSDQLLGQWWAFVLDLGYLLPEETIKTALWNIFRYNWRKSLRGFRHSQRIFAEGDESGLLNCTWPNGGRPRRPILYCDEVWTGIEYEVAALLLWCGMTNEALQIVKGARDRYDGTKRNPFAEVECGFFYIRALSSWGLLLAASGFACDAYAGILKFAPTLNADDFLAPFSAGIGWGVYRQERDRRNFSATVRWLGGEFSLRTLRLPASGHGEVQVTLNGAKVKTKERCMGEEFVVEFLRPLKLQPNSALKVTITLRV